MHCSVVHVHGSSKPGHKPKNGTATGHSHRPKHGTAHQPVVAESAVHLEQHLGANGRLRAVDRLTAASRVIGHHPPGRPGANDLDVVGVGDVLGAGVERRHV